MAVCTSRVRNEGAAAQKRSSCLSTSAFVSGAFGVNETRLQAHQTMTRKAGGRVDVLGGQDLACGWSRRVVMGGVMMVEGWSAMVLSFTVVLVSILCLCVSCVLCFDTRPEVPPACRQ